MAEEDEGALMERSRLLSRKWRRERARERKKEGEIGYSREGSKGNGR